MHNYTHKVPITLLTEKVESAVEYPSWDMTSGDDQVQRAPLPPPSNMSCPIMNTLDYM